MARLRCPRARPGPTDSWALPSPSPRVRGDHHCPHPVAFSDQATRSHVPPRGRHCHSHLHFVHEETEAQAVTGPAFTWPASGEQDWNLGTGPLPLLQPPGCGWAPLTRRVLCLGFVFHHVVGTRLGTRNCTLVIPGRHFLVFGLSCGRN